VSAKGDAAGVPNALPPNTRAASVLGPGAAAYARGREVAALLFWTLAAFVMLALASYAGDPSAGASRPNWVGPVGELCARGLVTIVGVVSWALPVELVLLGIPFVRGRKSLITPARVGGDILVCVIAAALVQVGWPGVAAFGKHPAAGLVGELFGELARSLFSTVGSFLVGFALLGLILIGRATFSFIALMQAIGRFGARGAARTAAGAHTVAKAWRQARELEREQRERARVATQPHIATETSDEATLAVLPFDEDDEPSPPSDPILVTTSPPAAVAPSDAHPAPGEGSKKRRRKRDPQNADAQLEFPPPIRPLKLDDLVQPAEPRDREPPCSKEKGPIAPSDLIELDITPHDPPPVEPHERARETEKPKRGRKAASPQILDVMSTTLEREIAAPAPAKEKKKAKEQGFVLPSIDFLIASKADPLLSFDREALLKNADLLVKTLADYGVVGKVEDILPGPTVTTFEVSPAAGTKVSKVASLADDLALALARKVRIVAPIPGKNRIGFELPNERRVPVNLRDLVEDRRFQSFDAPLPVVLGRDILGNPVYADLASMPHVIVAGATGAGKSVGLNVMLLSLLFRRTPEELRLLMVDPKVVELAPFDRIPHMLLPVVTDMKQAANSLKWAVDEMERRYQLFADAGTKNITTYNGWVDRVVRGEAKNPFATVVVARDHNGLPEEIPAGKDEALDGQTKLPEKLPFIVLVVDEFADLMMQQGKEVEAAVARLAQKARAAGMHVILATQRPSVDVITGMIKANFPTRIAYRVAQKVDSRTILDEQGAEHLLGRGDMLIKLNGTSDTKRVQCPMVSEEEVAEVTAFLRTQGEPVYDENILKPRDEEAAAEEEDAEQDPMYDDAVRVVADTRRCSTSWLQRKLGLGYNRAARIVEMMERRGLVGPANGSKDREVLVDPI
jgi:S-DNA-T family DNA segregation ATPase FtsK/SpoIIIE